MLELGVKNGHGDTNRHISPLDFHNIWHTIQLRATRYLIVSYHNENSW